MRRLANKILELYIVYWLWRGAIEDAHSSAYPIEALVQGHIEVHKVLEEFAAHLLCVMIAV